MKDPWQDPEVKRWVRDIKTNLQPMIEESAIAVSLCPPKSAGPDVKFALELGMMIMLDKPILVVAETNDDIPAKLRLIADEIVVGHVSEPGMQERLYDAMQRLDP